MKTGMQAISILPGWRLRLQVQRTNCSEGEWKEIMDVSIPEGNELVETEGGDIIEGNEPRTHGHLFTYELDLYGFKIPEESRGGKSATPAFRQPPIGVMPRIFHDERRFLDLMGAVERYEKAGFDPVPVWFQEIDEIKERWNWGSGRGGKSATPQTEVNHHG